MSEAHISRYGNAKVKFKSALSERYCVWKVGMSKATSKARAKLSLAA